MILLLEVFGCEREACVVIQASQHLISQHQWREVVYIGFDMSVWLVIEITRCVTDKSRVFWDKCVTSAAALSEKNLILKSTTHNFSAYGLSCHCSVWLIVMFVFQVEVKSKKEVSLLDLDDCEFISVSLSHSISYIYHQKFAVPLSSLCLF